MFTIELFVPPGALTPQRRAQLAEQLATTAVVTEDMAAAETVEATRVATDVIIHEPATWFVGRRQLGTDRPPRYLVRVSVPGAWRKELSEHLTTQITQALAELDEDPDRLYREPDAIVQVVGIPEGGYGLFGRVFGSNELGDLHSTPFREARHAGTAQQPPPGMVIDPACGAVMSLDAEETVALELDGVTYGFCCTHCRDTFTAERNDATAHA